MPRPQPYDPSKLLHASEPLIGVRFGIGIGTAVDIGDRGLANPLLRRYSFDCDIDPAADSDTVADGITGFAIAPCVGQGGARPQLTTAHNWTFLCAANTGFFVLDSGPL